MKTYAIVGNQYEGLYTKPWSVSKLTQTKPAPNLKDLLPNLRLRHGLIASFSEK